MTKKSSKSELAPIWSWKITALSAALLVIVGVLAISFGPVKIEFLQIIRTLLGLPGGLSGQERTLLIDLRLPRALLAALVGAALATSGAVYQTVFRNPLADPYLLGAAAGAGLGATIAITSAGADLYSLLPIFSFIGAILAVLVSFFISGKFFAEPNSLLLSGIAVGSFATAVQTYLQQRNSDSLRPVYSWILGELTVANWQKVIWSSIYIFIALAICHR